MFYLGNIAVSMHQICKTPALIISILQGWFRFRRGNRIVTRPALEAFALPNSTERATLVPTPIWKSDNMPFTHCGYRASAETLSHPVGIYRCNVLGLYLKIASFQATKRQSAINAFIYMSSQPYLCARSWAAQLRRELRRCKYTYYIIMLAKS